MFCRLSTYNSIKYRFFYFGRGIVQLERGCFVVIGDNIRKYRQAANMEQSDLADRLHISNKTISSWECGRTEPRMGMIEAMCQVFGCQKTELIDGKTDVDYVFSDGDREFLIEYHKADEQTKAMIDRILHYHRKLTGGD